MSLHLNKKKDAESLIKGEGCVLAEVAPKPPLFFFYFKWKYLKGMQIVELLCSLRRLHSWKCKK